MKKIAYIFFLCLSVSTFAQNNSEAAKNKTEEDIVTKPDVAAIPPYGSYEAFYRYVGRTLQMPAEAYKKEISAECMVRFIVYPNGTPGIFKIMGGIPECPSCEKTAINIIKTCPNKWTPGMKDGKPVKTYVDLPIRFDAH